MACGVSLLLAASIQILIILIFHIFLTSIIPIHSSVLVLLSISGLSPFIICTPYHLSSFALLPFGLSYHLSSFALLPFGLSYRSIIISLGSYHNSSLVPIITTFSYHLVLHTVGHEQLMQIHHRNKVPFELQVRHTVGRKQRRRRKRHCEGWPAHSFIEHRAFVCFVLLWLKGNHSWWN